MLNRELEPTGDEMHALVDGAARMVIDYLTGMKEGPASHLENERELTALLREPLPEQGAKADELIDLIKKTVVGCAVNTAGATYQAYIPGGGIFSAAVAEFMAAATNRYVGVWRVAPCAAQIEATVIRWLCDVAGYGEQARGILTSGGSMANFSAIVAARRALLPAPLLLRQGALYCPKIFYPELYMLQIRYTIPYRKRPFWQVSLLAILEASLPIQIFE
jgi:aromatic-L-amino-acid/L-tryptophan decarboxylase